MNNKHKIASEPNHHISISYMSKRYFNDMNDFFVSICTSNLNARAIKAMINHYENFMDLGLSRSMAGSLVQPFLRIL